MFKLVVSIQKLFVTMIQYMYMYIYVPVATIAVSINQIFLPHKYIPLANQVVI